MTRQNRWLMFMVLFMTSILYSSPSGPLFLEPYWRRNAAASAVLVTGWHRMGYQANGDSFMSLELQRDLRLLHGSVRNAVSRDRFIVFAAGSTQLINTAVYALSPNVVNINDSFTPALVVAAAPFNMRNYYVRMSDVEDRTDWFKICTKLYKGSVQECFDSVQKSVQKL